MPDSNDWIKTALAQKMMLDFRFYCEQKKKHCTEPLVVLNPEIKRFIKDEIRLLECGIAHYSKWSPLVYHRNVRIPRKIEKRTFEIILKRLEKM